MLTTHDSNRKHRAFERGAKTSMATRPQPSARRRVARLVVALLAFAGVWGPVGPGVPGASAVCASFGSWDFEKRIDPNTIAAIEDAWYSSTCDSDNFYAGGIIDTYTDGSCAYVQMSDAGYFATQGYDCNGSWVYYGFNDTNGNSSSTMYVGPSYDLESTQHDHY